MGFAMKWMHDRVFRLWFAGFLLLNCRIPSCLFWPCLSAPSRSCLQSDGSYLARLHATFLCFTACGWVFHSKRPVGPVWSKSDISCTCDAVVTSCDLDVFCLWKTWCSNRKDWNECATAFRWNSRQGDREPPPGKGPSWAQADFHFSSWRRGLGSQPRVPRWPHWDF